MTSFTLRPYQTSAVDRAIAGLAHPDSRTYLALPTGSGKTFVLAAIAQRRLSVGRILVVAHRIEIAEQIRAALEAVCDVPIGLIGDAQCEHPEAAIVVAMVQSLHHKTLDRLTCSGSIASVLIDESHHVAPGNSYAKLIDAVALSSPHVSVLGVTATPYRMGAARMQDVLTTCIFDRSIDDMIALGVLTPLRNVALDVKLDLRKAKTLKGDYAQRDLEHAMSDRVIASTVRLSKPHLKNRRAIAFAVSVTHARALRDAYERAGVHAWLVHGEMPRRERSATLVAWRSEVGVLVNVDIASEGFDEPSVSAIVLAAPTQSPGRYVQRVGRGTRRAPGKVDCVVIDVTGSASQRDDRQVLFDNVFLRPTASDVGLANGGSQNSRRLLVTPTDDRRNAWVSIGSDAAAMSIGDGIWVVQRERDDSGLWSATLFSKTIVTERHDGLPCAEVLERVHRSIRSSGPNKLTKRDAPWRSEPATEPMLRYIATFDRSMAIAARTQKWTKGAATEFLTRASALQVIRSIEVADAR